jgi:Spy/CpxP family protein refolding chaperone
MEDKKKMKPRKKLIAGLMAAMIITTIGAVYATEQTDGTTPNATPQEPYGNKHDLNQTMWFGYNLTTEQQTELDELLTTLKEQNATPQEIRTAIFEKLDEFGVFDTQLATQIAQTEQRLAILNREKELRDQGDNWTTIQEMIKEEYNVTAPQVMIPGVGFGCEHGRRGPPGFPDQNMKGTNRPPRDDQNTTASGQPTIDGQYFGQGSNGGTSESTQNITPEI